MQKNKRSISVSLDKAWQAEIARYDNTGVTAGGLIKHWLEEYFELLAIIPWEQHMDVTTEEIDELAKIPAGLKRATAVSIRAHQYSVVQLYALEHLVESAAAEGYGVIDQVRANFEQHAAEYSARAS